MKSISSVHFIDKLVKKNTVEEDLRELNEQNDVVEIFADPYQMHRSITTLQAAGVPIKEYAQTQANCTLMGQTLFDFLTGLNLEVYPSDELRQQALSTVAVENPRGWRIAKEKASKKIDAIVALAMACVAAMAHRGEIMRDEQVRDAQALLQFVQQTDRGGACGRRQGRGRLVQHYQLRFGSECPRDANALLLTRTQGTRPGGQHARIEAHKSDQLHDTMLHC